jgi:tyrosinase
MISQVAAYDPLFFMHHANLDRLTALYQRKNPDSWIEETHERHVKNYMVGLGGHITNSSTPLWPFRWNTCFNLIYQSFIVRCAYQVWAFYMG